MGPKLTRREVVLAGGLGVAGGMAASLPAQAGASGALEGSQRELRTLQSLLGIEQVLEYAYRRVLRSWMFNSSTREALELMLRHETEHTAVLQGQLATLSGGLPGGGASGSAMSEVAGLLNGARTPRDAVRVLTKVESLAEAEYFNAVADFQSPQLALLAAQILSCEAQHWTLLLNVLTEGHLPQIVPDAYVRGVGSIT